MRGFLVLCLVAAVSAKGYNYSPNTANSHHHDHHSASSGGSLSGTISSSGSSGSFGSGSSFSGTSIASGSGVSGLSAPAQTITELNKEYYLYSAPEEVSHSNSNSQGSTTTLKKNLRVIFIKAPENNGVASAALQVAKQISEDQTAIYVLTKEADVSDISQKLQQISEIRSQKPEVRFVKYRTAQDAINAQRTIQAQYDALGGSTKSSNEGIAPVLNYASKASDSNIQGSSTHIAGSIGTSSSPQKSYLPPVSFR